MKGDYDSQITALEIERDALAGRVSDNPAALKHLIATMISLNELYKADSREIDGDSVADILGY